MSPVRALHAIFLVAALISSTTAAAVRWGDDDPDCSSQSGVFPYPGDCSKYVICAGGFETIKDCPSDQDFSPYDLKCEDPVEAQCDPRYTTAASTPTTRGVPTPSPSPSACDVDCSKQTGLFPCPGDCSRYVMCVGGFAHINTCPSGKEFSPYDLICEDPSVAGCSSTPIPSTRSPTTRVPVTTPTPSPTTVPTPSPTTVPKTTPTPSPQTRIPSSSGTPIPVDCSKQSGLFPYPGDCTKYVLCSGGFGKVNYCPPNTEFSPYDLRCEDPSEARCSSGTGSTGFTRSTPSTWPQTFTTEPAPSTKRSTPNTKSTLPPTSGNPTTSHTQSPSPFPGFQCPTQNGIFPHPYYCQDFIECSNGYAYIFVCPSDLWFNPKTSSCDYPKNVDCHATPPPTASFL